jgi:thiosulfate/3-mercaptopyruvate sulfurtransferase
MASGAMQRRRGRLTRSDVLVEPEWLQEHLHDAGLRLVEVDVSRAAYDGGHIEGAVLWNVYSDLKDPEYRLIDKPATERLLGRSGIGPDSVVVLYGYAPTMGFWLLKLYGHADVRILNCARNVWHDAGRPWATEAATPVATSYGLPNQDERIRADRWGVEEAIDRPDSTIVDVRTDSEYRGERFWPSGGLEEGGRAGHVPSAVNLSIEDVQDKSGSFRPAADLRRLFSSIDLSGDGEIISYCTIGGRASTAWFVLSYLLGRDRVRVYDGSWAEWGLTASTPVSCAEGGGPAGRPYGAQHLDFTDQQ